MAASLAICTVGAGRAVSADCAVFDQLEMLHVMQTRLARNPDTVLFQTDIDQLQALSSTINSREVLEAIKGFNAPHIEVDFLRFIQNTRLLLQRASPEDPQTVRPHFDSETRQNLWRVGTHLNNTGCNAPQFSHGAPNTGEPPHDETDDGSDMQEVVETIRRIADKVLRPQTLLLFVLLGTSAPLAVTLFRRRQRAQRRRAKRHSVSYATQYMAGKHQNNGVLIDINCFGSKLRREAENPLSQGENVQIEICDKWIGGTAMWSNAHYSGIKFHKPIPMADVESVCASKAPLKTKNGAPKDAVSH